MSNMKEKIKDWWKNGGYKTKEQIKDWWENGGNKTKEQIDAWRMGGGVKIYDSNCMEKETAISLITTLTDFLNKVDESAIQLVSNIRDGERIEIIKKDYVISLSIKIGTTGKTYIALADAGFSVVPWLDITDYGVLKDTLLCAINRVKKLYEDRIAMNDKMRVQGFIDKLKDLTND